MLQDFNLLVTTSRGNEEDACTEIWYLLGEIGDRSVVADKTGITGLLAAKTVLDPLQVIDEFRKILTERPSEFRYTLRVIPIQKVVRTNLKEIQYVAAALASEIKANETFRVTVEKRFSDIATKDIIEAAAAKIERKVDLERPDKIVLVEVIGKLTGVSVIEPKDIMSVVKETPSPK